MMIIYDACSIVIFIWDVGLLIILVDSLAYLNKLHLLVLCLLCLSYHDDWSCCMIICLVLSLLSLSVDMDDTHALHDYVLHDYPFVAWLYVACLCGMHIYPFISSSLVSIDFIFLELVFDIRLVTLFVLRPS